MIMKGWFGERPLETSNEWWSCKKSETSISSQSLRDFVHHDYVTHLCDAEFESALSLVILGAISVFKLELFPNFF